MTSLHYLCCATQPTNWWFAVSVRHFDALLFHTDVHVAACMTPHYAVVYRIKILAVCWMQVRFDTGSMKEGVSWSSRRTVSCVRYAWAVSCWSMKNYRTPRKKLVISAELEKNPYSNLHWRLKEIDNYNVIFTMNFLTDASRQMEPSNHKIGSSKILCIEFDIFFSV